MLKIKRIPAFANKLRAYKVLLDGEQVGRIKEGQEIEVPVSPGRHRLHLKIDWCWSNVVEFTAAEQDIFFECGASLRGKKFWLPFIEVWYITAKRKQYLWLKEKELLTKAL